MISKRLPIIVAMTAVLHFACLLAFAPVCANESPVLQTPTVAPALPVVEGDGEGFRKAIVKAAVDANRKGVISRGQLFRLRVAMLSPNFRAEAQALTLMEAKGVVDLPMASDGSVAVAAIDWNALADFLEKMIPLIIKLIDLFSWSTNATTFWVDAGNASTFDTAICA